MAGRAEQEGAGKLTGMRFFQLRHKFILCAFGVVILFCAVIVMFINTMLHKKLDRELQNEAIFLAEHLASLCVGPIVTESEIKLQTLINDAKEAREPIDYIFVVNPRDQLLAHTFANTFPTALKQANVVQKGGRYSSRKVLLDDRKISEVAVPIVKGQLGFLHLGFSEAFVHKTVNDTLMLVVLITAAFLAAGFFIILFLVRKITSPLAELVHAAEFVGKGDLSTEIKVESHDEICALAAAFDKMRMDLKNTLQSLKEHQENLESTVRKRTVQLHMKNEEIEARRKKLQTAFNEISDLLEKVIKQGEFGVSYYSHPALKKCWEFLKCDKEECPCYGKAAMRCWQITGTHCRDSVQGDFLDKFEDCKQCDFYTLSKSDAAYQIGEQFNNMMYVLEKNNQELEEAYEKLKQSQSTILQQEKMASVGQLAAGVAHEINNPVGFIMSNMGSLQKYIDRLKEFIAALTEASGPVLPPEASAELKGLRKKLKVDFVLGDSADLIKECLEGADRVKEIVQNLKSFSRIDQAEAKSADINECLESTLKIVWNELKYKCEVVKEYGDLPNTYCNPQQLNQVFVNLLVNAAHAIEERGTITIRSWSEKDTIFVSIADTGSGIPEKNMSRLFEPFFTTKEVGKGTGLGLSIAYDIVTKKHEGELLVESEVGKGTTFTVKIPVVKKGVGDD